MQKTMHISFMCLKYFILVFLRPAARLYPAFFKYLINYFLYLKEAQIETTTGITVCGGVNIREI